MPPTAIEKAVFLAETDCRDVVGGSVKVFGAETLDWQVPEKVDLRSLLEEQRRGQQRPVPSRCVAGRRRLSRPR